MDISHLDLVIPSNHEERDTHTCSHRPDSNESMCRTPCDQKDRSPEKTVLGSGSVLCQCQGPETQSGAMEQTCVRTLNLFPWTYLLLRESLYSFLEERAICVPYLAWIGPPRLAQWTNQVWGWKACERGHTIKEWETQRTGKDRGCGWSRYWIKKAGN